MKSNSYMKPASDSSILSGTSLPPPDPDKRTSHKLALLAICAVIALAAAVYWLSRSPDEKTALRHGLAQQINSTLADTPLAGAGSILTPAPEARKPHIPPTEAGTLAGREVTGTIAAPVDLSRAGAAGYALPRTAGAEETPAEPSAIQTMAEMMGFVSAPQETPLTFSQDVLPPATEDTTLKSGYITRLANWLVSRSSSAGAFTATPQSLNLECGSALTSDIAGGRSALLRYAFHPTMLSALYNLYINRFMAEIDEAARKKGLNDSQLRQLHHSLAGHAALLARAVAGVEQVPDLQGRLQTINRLGQKAVDANSRLTGMVFELDRLRESTAPESAYNLVQDQMQNAAAEYSDANRQHDEAQNALAALIRKSAGPGLNDDTLLFIAAWIERRMTAGGDAKAAVRTAAGLLTDFADRCAKSAEEY